MLVGNDSVTLCWADADQSSELYRNAAGDEIVYLHSGAARLESVFGSLDVATGDYVVLPASTTHRWVIASDGPVAPSSSKRPAT